MSSIFALLVLTSSLSAIYCFDCSLIKPNGTYTGLSMYPRLDGKQNIEYWMKNSLGKEWRFGISEDGLITADDNTVRDAKPKIGKSFYTRLIDRVERNGVMSGMDCDVSDDQSFIDGRYWRNFVCSEFNYSSYGITNINDSLTTKNPLYFGPYYLFATETKVKELDRQNRTYKRIIWFKKTIISLKCQDIGKDYEQDIKDFCDKWFTDQMSDELYRQMETTFKWYEKKDTQVLWFNIDGRPKYCIQISTQKLSDECKDSTYMRTAFDDCFEQSVSQSLGLTITVLIFLIILVIILVIVLWILIKKFKRIDEIDEKSDSQTFSKTFKQKT